MANQTAAYGFVPMYHLSGEIRMIECSKAAGLGEAHFVGDPVKMAGSADSEGRPTVQVADAADATIFGVIKGIKPVGPDSLNVLKSPASTAATLIVVPATAEMVFRVNAEGATGAALNDVGLTYDHVTTAGDALTGRSDYEIDVGEGGGDAPATTGRQWRCIGFDRRPDNEFSATVSTNTPNVDMLVTCVESVWNGQAATGGDGV